MAATNMEEIALYIKQMRFKKKMFGGVQEMDVWRKVEQLHQQYESVFAVQQALYQQQLAQKDAQIARLEAQLNPGQPEEES